MQCVAELDSRCFSCQAGKWVRNDCGKCLIKDLELGSKIQERIQDVSCFMSRFTRLKGRYIGLYFFDSI